MHIYNSVYGHNLISCIILSKITKLKFYILLEIKIHSFTCIF